MTEGDKRWIKKHTEKTLKELKMKPTKKRPAKRKPLHGESNPLLAKLMNLKYRLNDAYHLRDIENSHDKAYVIGLISDIRHNSKKFTKLCKEDFEKCNALWKQYE